jgi:hypothetical protein
MANACFEQFNNLHGYALHGAKLEIKVGVVQTRDI